MSLLNDINHYWGQDIVPASIGELGTANGTLRGQQRILRRLLTNPGDYVFHPGYGAGLPAKVGQTVDIPGIRALIRGQILLEDAVARTPIPQITVVEIPNGVSVTVNYTDASTGNPAVLSFSVNR